MYPYIYNQPYILIMCDGCVLECRWECHINKSRTAASGGNMGLGSSAPLVTTWLSTVKHNLVLCTCLFSDTLLSITVDSLTRTPSAHHLCLEEAHLIPMFSL